jgi:hypothetical protein
MAVAADTAVGDTGKFQPRSKGPSGVPDGPLRALLNSIAGQLTVPRAGLSLFLSRLFQS